MACGVLVLITSLATSAVTFVSIAETVRIGDTARALNVVECNITRGQVLDRAGYCAAEDTSIWRTLLNDAGLRKPGACFAPQWDVLYADLDPHGEARQKLGAHPAGIITGTLSQHKHEASVTLAKFHGPRLQPCQYDKRDPSTGYWSPEALDRQARLYQNIAMLFGSVGLASAIIAGLALKGVIRRLRRERRQFSVNAAPAATVPLLS
jgi:hypothetical protein